MIKSIHTIHKVLVSAVFVVVIFLSLFVGPLAVHAHATPVSYEPVQNEVLKAMPEGIRISFTERIEAGASSITVLDGTGTSLTSEDPFVPEDNDRALVLPLAEADEAVNGSYTVSWKVVSADDGHFTKGAYTFRIGDSVEDGAASTVTGQVQIQHLTTLPETIIIWIELIGFALILGACAVFLVVAGRNSVSLSALLARLTWTGFALAILAVLAFIVLKTLDLSQLHASIFSETLGVFLDTSSGTFALVRLGFLVLGAIIFLLWRFRSSRNVYVYAGLTLATVAAALYTKAHVSHAAAAQFLPSLGIGFMSVHLFSKVLWVGVVVAFVSVMIRAFHTSFAGERLREYTSRFSMLAAAAFGVTAVSGMYITWIDLKDIANVFSTEWGTRFLVLVLFGFAVLTVRLIHFFICEHRGAHRFSAWYIPTLILEGLLGIALLFSSALLSITTPPFLIEAYDFNVQEESQGVLIELAAHPYDSEAFLLTLVDAETGTPVSTDQLSVALEHPARGIGPLYVTGEMRAPGRFAFPRAALSPAGEWEVRVTGTRTADFDVTAQFVLSYPSDVEESRRATDRPDDPLLLLGVLAGALGGIVLAAGMVYVSGLRLRVSPKRSLTKEADVAGERGGMRRDTLVALLIFAAALAVVWGGYEYGIKSDFQRLCERNGHFWIQSAPMRDGETVSPNTTTGCTLDVGLHHFASQEEYKHFLRPIQTNAELVHETDTIVAGEPTDFSVRLYEVVDGQRQPLETLGITHDRILHALVVGEDLETFAHIHTEDVAPVTPAVRERGVYPLRHTFPAAGEYSIIIDYAARGREFSEVFHISVEGEPRLPSFEEDLSRTKIFDGYTVTLDTPERVSVDQPLLLDYYIERNGEPVDDLEPYLAATMHIGIARSDLRASTHAHGEIYLPGTSFFQGIAAEYIEYHSHFAPERFGPRVRAGIGEELRLSEPGVYAIFGEFKHKGEVVVTKFMIEVTK